MHTFKVWAPLPKKVEVQVKGKILPLTALANGWWTAEVAPAGPGDDYGFILDDEGPFPDPRSAWQPHGVHGLSRLVEHGAHVWTDAGWQAPPLSSAVVYELHLGTFTPEGTCAAAIERLDHLVGLGVTHVELMPVNEFPGKRGWGYDGAELFAPHHVYGGPDGLKRLVEACHARRLAVLLDVVYNHLGPDGNYLPKFAPCFTERHCSPWGRGLNFDGPDSDGMRRFFCDNALMWLRDYHFDGLRLDAVHAIIDTSAETFLEQLSIEVEQLEARLGRHLVLIAESDSNDPRLLWPRECGGSGLAAQWNDDFHHALHSVLSGERDGYYADFGALGDLAAALRHAYVYDGRYSAHRKRRHGRSTDGLSGHRFLAYSQNHDQIGNRVQGDRSSQFLSVGRLKIAAVLVLTSPFVPMLFQGEEWGATTPFLYFTDYQEAGLAAGARERRCREFAAFGWKPGEVPDPQACGSFEASKLDWTELKSGPHDDLLEWHRRLIKLRHDEPELTDGRKEAVQTRFSEAGRWLAVERGTLTVACNLGNAGQTIPLRAGEHRVIMASAPAGEKLRDQIQLPQDSVVILRMV